MAQSAATAGLLAASGRSLFAAPPVAGEAAKMAIARWKGAAQPTPEQIKDLAVRLTEKALEGLGGIERFVKKGSVVFIKPNMSWDRTPEQAANSNPDVIATIVKKCLEAGAKTVRVGDNTCNPKDKAYANSGVAEAAKNAGAEVLTLDKTRFKETEIKGELIKTIPIHPQTMECDLFINVPIVKHHRLTKLTACMKNYMGIIENRQKFHQNIPACLVDLTQYMKPQLCILDAVRILTANGPTGGNLQDVQTKLTVAAGVDIVALDALGAELMGLKAADVGTIVAGEKAKLGVADYRTLSPKEIDVA
jgi:uncharacterized protein (DUF362 family)